MTRASAAAPSTHYEVCALSSSKDETVDGPFAVIDTAIEAARKASTKAKHAGRTLIVVCAEDAQSRRPQTRVVRAFAAGGRIEWAKRCERCEGKGVHVIVGGLYRSNREAPCHDCMTLGSLPESKELSPPSTLRSEDEVIVIGGPPVIRPAMIGNIRIQGRIVP